MLSSGIEQERNADGSPAAGHPNWKPHPMQGWSPDFIAKLAGDAVASKAISQVLRIAGPDALRCSKELARKEGIFVGISSGATFAGALRVAAEAPKGSTILCMLPDTGERYLSTPLFARRLSGHDETKSGRLRAPRPGAFWSRPNRSGLGRIEWTGWRPRPAGSLSSIMAESHRSENCAWQERLGASFRAASTGFSAAGA